MIRRAKHTALDYSGLSNATLGRHGHSTSERRREHWIEREWPNCPGGRPVLALHLVVLCEHF
jgi:hypothetical protein